MVENFPWAVVGRDPDKVVRSGTDELPVGEKILVEHHDSSNVQLGGFPGLVNVFENNSLDNCDFEFGVPVLSSLHNLLRWYCLSTIRCSNDEFQFLGSTVRVP